MDNKKEELVSELNHLKLSLVHLYNLTEVEQFYLFDSPGGVTKAKLAKILICRIQHYQRVLHKELTENDSI